MSIKLVNLKGTKDYLPEEQYLRNKIRFTLEEVFKSYGFRPLETPILCFMDVLSSKYAGGAEILKEIYQLSDQGQRELALRYDLTVPFARVIGMNPQLRLPFKRYEIGKVFRDGPVKTGRMREFMQCDVDIAGASSMMAEAEFILMVLDIFDKFGLDVYVSYNNRKLLSGILQCLQIPDPKINNVILSLDKLEKIGPEGVRQEIEALQLQDDMIERIFNLYDNKQIDLDYFSDNFPNSLVKEGINELKELNEYLLEVDALDKTRFNPFLARGLDIYTGTVFEVFLTDGAISSSIAAGGRYDKIIGGFLDDGKEYPAVGISFGLDVIYNALSMKKEFKNNRSEIDFYIIPLGTNKESLRLASLLRKNGWSVDIDMTGRRLKKSLDYANKEKIPYVIIYGEDELKSGIIKFKDMEKGEEKSLSLQDIPQELKRFLPKN
ncbi:MAG TPA: histidine--tRNA ligase [Firmicutes bacterium]|jgi:histidyl-tRNA synthetase|nr:histidine--tRNA ligase [Bacillota bacterium]